MENGWEEEDDKNEKLPIKGLPASFPAVRPSLLFHLALLLNGLAVGLLPALFLAIVPVPHGWEEQGVFWKDSFFLVIVSLLGLGISIILTLIHVPVKFLGLGASGGGVLATICGARKEEGWRSMLCRLLTWTRTLYLSPEDPSDMAKLITQVIQTVNLPPNGFTSSSFASSDSQAMMSKTSSSFSGMDLSSIQRDVELMKYRLEGTETLEGLALKFGCKVEELRRLNGIPSIATGCPLAAYKNLWVPLRSPELKEEAKKKEEAAAREAGGDQIDLEITN
ncbi:hypothetical protein GUITHDRAFT_144916 [Guillardia theta CCMP2712]|uniref:LysM domain-containing protein n=1 Tax=Guillardia theta (strain CCMP2712) TaxID=905079 RepID=L1IN04_GUITC|nr:hypothetical protein GUITHDRAFT_144916 [Guillardia theta CCMP2712]EKX37477.1 hypothetical protein GUITHDRAFT_144916 [Guillardia theta CCMP2712]|eukprot:XP_005824457.1 hypothetical protein GUITHDRAFT_144916 [Guillardia theta CCMP2712]